MKYGFIGCGNMGGAVARAVCKGAAAGAVLKPPGGNCAVLPIHKKPGRTFLFAPAVLLLRSHSLITLTRYFSDCTLVFIRIILTLRYC